MADGGSQKLDVRLPDGTRLAQRSDYRQVGGIIAEAFSEDPVNLWIFGNPDPMPTVFSALARSVYLARGTCHLTGDSAASMWSHSSADRELSLPATLSLSRPLPVSDLVGSLGPYSSRAPEDLGRREGVGFFAYGNLDVGVRAGAIAAV